MLFPSNKKIVVSIDTKTAIQKTFNFLLHLAREAKDLESFVKDLQDYKAKMEKQELDHDVMSCYPAHEAAYEAGVKAVNPKIAYKLTMAMPWGDPYCEEVYELRDE